MQPWHDFFALSGSASATLVGLMFVAASVSAGFFTRERQVGLRTFLTPTVVAFSVVLTTSLIGVLPVSDPHILAGLVAGIGLLGLGYSWHVWRRSARAGMIARIDHEDRVWYFAAPAVAYIVFAVAGAAFGLGSPYAPILLAISAGLLLLAGIRNAWDMTTFVVMRRNDPAD